MISFLENIKCLLIRSHDTCIFKMYRINDTIYIIYYLANIILILYFDEKLHKLFPSIDCFIVNMNYEYENAKVVTDCYMNELYVIYICISSKQQDGEAAAIKNSTYKKVI